MNDTTKNSIRASGSFLSDVFAHPSFAALRAVEVGCLFAWCRLLSTSGRTALPMTEARDFAAHFAQLDDTGFQTVLGTLRALHLVTVGDDILEINAYSSAVHLQREEHDRRKSGWEKRRSATAAKSDPTAPAPAASNVKPLSPAVAARPAPTISFKHPTPAQSNADSSSGATAPAASPAAPHAAPVAVPVDPMAQAESLKPKAKQSPSNGTMTFGGDPADKGPIAVTVPCQGGKVAEFTEGYVARMKTLYPQLDVRLEMMRAANWCTDNPTKQKTLQGIRRFMTSWLSRATERQDTRAAVVATQNSRNGFGNGGIHPVKSVALNPSPQMTLPASGVDEAGDIGDLGDLLPPAGAKPVGSRLVARGVR